MDFWDAKMLQEFQHVINNSAMTLITVEPIQVFGAKYFATYLETKTRYISLFQMLDLRKISTLKLFLQYLYIYIDIKDLIGVMAFYSACTLISGMYYSIIFISCSCS